MAKPRINDGDVKTEEKNGKKRYYVAKRKNGVLHWYASDAKGNRLFRGGKKIKKAQNGNGKSKTSKKKASKKKTTKKRKSTRRKSEAKICLTLSQLIKILKG